MSNDAERGHSLPRLTAIMNQLLSPDGCPWDKEQSLQSLRPYVLEEAFEVVDAIDSFDVARPTPLKEELGDLLFQVVFLSALAEREGHFDLDDVVGAISDKMVRRHPWVFGDERVDGSEGALGRWEAMKAKEKKDRGALGGVPAALPALLRAQRVGEKAAAVGYDFADAEAARTKLDEELSELDRASASNDVEACEEELGDALFSLVNYARKKGLDAEGALRRSVQKFSQRFRHAELAADGELRGKSAEELDVLWNAAKAEISK